MGHFFINPIIKYQISKTTFKSSLNSHDYWDTLYIYPEAGAYTGWWGARMNR